MHSLDAVLAALVEVEEPGPDGVWRVERDGVSVGELKAMTISSQTWWQVTWPWRPGPMCDLEEARRWLAQYLLDHPTHPADS